MIYIWRCDRALFSKLIANHQFPDGFKIEKCDKIPKHTIGGNELILVWPKSPESAYRLPHAVIVADEYLHDFIAWVSTYFRNVRPFTAHCRVLAYSLACIAMRSSESDMSSGIQSVKVGIILAEGIAYSVGRTDLDRLPLSAFVRTLSFAYARSIKVYNQSLLQSNEIIDQIKTGWVASRKLTNQASMDLSPDDVSYVWKAILCTVLKNNKFEEKSKIEPLILRALSEIKNEGVVSAGLVARMPGVNKKVLKLFEALEGPREGRVEAVELVINELMKSPSINKKIRSFILGYIASRIKTGFLEHFSLLTPAISKMGDSFLWYGACSGLSPRANVENYADGLGLIIARELSRTTNWLDRPNCDISLPEMEVLLKNRDKPNLNIWTIAKGTLKVEIFPLICSEIKWRDTCGSKFIEKEESHSYQKKMFEDDLTVRQDLVNLIEQIKESSQMLSEIKKSVESKFGKH